MGAEISAWAEGILQSLRWGGGGGGGGGGGSAYVTLMKLEWAVIRCKYNACRVSLLVSHNLSLSYTQ